MVTRALKWVAIKLRWPMVVLVFAVVAFHFESQRTMYYGNFTPWLTHTTVSYVVYPDLLQIGWDNSWGDAYFLSQRSHRSMYHGLWQWSFRRDARGEYLVVFPIWALAAPPALLAAVGFRLNRTRKKLAAQGACKKCGYLLRGATVCPECGQTAGAVSAA